MARISALVFALIVALFAVVRLPPLRRGRGGPRGSHGLRCARLPAHSGRSGWLLASRPGALMGPRKPSAPSAGCAARIRRLPCGALGHCGSRAGAPARSRSLFWGEFYWFWGCTPRPPERWRCATRANSAEDAKFTRHVFGPVSCESGVFNHSRRPLQAFAQPASQQQCQQWKNQVQQVSPSWSLFFHMSIFLGCPKRLWREVRKTRCCSSD